MFDPNAQLEALPDYWQERIRRYKAENYSLRKRLNKANEIELSPRWHKRLSELRKENAKYRTERNQARAALVALRAEVEAGRTSE